MSTKPNAEELASKRWPDTQAQKNTWRGMVKYMVNRGRERKAYAAAIREVAQPIADERDELREALEWIRSHGIPATARDDYRRGYMDARDDMAEHARAILAKYPKP